MIGKHLWKGDILSKNQLPCLSISGTLDENGLIAGVITGNMLLLHGFFLGKNSSVNLRMTVLVGESMLHSNFIVF